MYNEMSFADRVRDDSCSRERKRVYSVRTGGAYSIASSAVYSSRLGQALLAREKTSVGFAFIH